MSTETLEGLLLYGEAGDPYRYAGHVRVSPHAQERAQERGLGQLPARAAEAYREGEVREHWRGPRVVHRGWVYVFLRMPDYQRGPTLITVWEDEPDE